MDIGGEAVGVNDLTIRKGRVVVYKRRVETGVQSVGLDDAVIGDSKAAAKNEPTAKVVSLKLPRTPGKTELRTEVGLLGVNWLPPVRTLMFENRLAPVPNSTVASKPFFSEIAPKYSQRRPAVTVRLGLSL